MAYNKRSRSAYEADLQSKESPFVAYGTALPPLDSEARDDGSYVPVWKQEVTDERGRKRLHGAFTGGFSAGYFNTVGSKEGWTPSTFVSSRTNRRKDEQKQQKVEDFMDEEDLTAQAEAQQLETNQDFTGLGTTQADASRQGKVMDLFRTQGETMGVKLLRKMGWRDGQGIGPPVRRKARFQEGAEEDGQDQHTFAPDDTDIATFMRKDDRKGLGSTDEAKLANDTSDRKNSRLEDEEDRVPYQPPSKPSVAKPNLKPRTGAFGMGVLNDTGSDDEDPYAMGPSMSYNRVIGGDKKKSKIKVKKAQTTANPLLGSKPVFRSKKASSASGFRKCHDGRLPLDGFALAEPLDSLSISDDSERYPIPQIPEGWKTTKTQATTTKQSEFQSTSEAAKASKLDPKARAALIGESQLPGKSVFDFMSSTARERLASASGRQDLPAAKGETMPGVKHEDEGMGDLPQLDKNTAAAALSRGVGGWMPYADEPAKRERYRGFLEVHAGIRESLAPRPPELKRTAWLHELREFAHAARVFRPVTGAMASRFQSSSAAPQSSTSEEVLRAPIEKAKDPAEEAARLGMFGPLTRSILTFYPTRLVCKRFNVKVPAHATSANEGTAAHGDVDGMSKAEEESSGVKAIEMAPAAPMAMKSFSKGGVEHAPPDIQGALDEGGLRPVKLPDPAPEPPSTETNDALEAKRAGEELFRAVFGDDSD